jgi:hypothetical protein
MSGAAPPFGQSDVINGAWPVRPGPQGQEDKT